MIRTNLNVDQLQPTTCARKLAALAAPERLRIVQFLRHGARNVGEIAEMLQAPLCNVSHHLHVLSAGGLVGRVKRGRFVLYSLLPEVFVPDNPEGSQDHLDLGCCRLELPPEG